MQNIEGTKAFWVDDPKPTWKPDLNMVKAILKTNVYIHSKNQYVWFPWAKAGHKMRSKLLDTRKSWTSSRCWVDTTISTIINLTFVSLGDLCVKSMFVDQVIHAWASSPSQGCVVPPYAHMRVVMLFISAPSGLVDFQEMYWFKWSASFVSIH